MAKKLSSAQAHAVALAAGNGGKLTRSGAGRWIGRTPARSVASVTALALVNLGLAVVSRTEKRAGTYGGMVEVPVELTLVEVRT